MLYTSFLVWIMYLIRPNERSKMLAEMHELNDTSTTHRSHEAAAIEMHAISTTGNGEQAQKQIKKKGKKVI